ncbi:MULTISPECIES: hypothetical protein [unclassified Streptomyces]|uniref:hypothetical protein n=1 Tax=unclassified Streptomyces TaxID=2593676 RepID=UPI002E2C20BA|nr:hypothetical protein [Streptomyces sp. NBC_00273]
MLIDQVEGEEGSEAWDELWDRLCLHGETVFPASLAALPRLVKLARKSPQALDLAGAIVRGTRQEHDGDARLADCADTVAELRTLLDRNLQSQPADYLRIFRDLLAAEGQGLWSAALGDFTDDFYHLPCPNCTIAVTVAVGEYGRYSAVRDWDLGDVDRRPLRPALATDLSDTGRWIYEKAIRDGQDDLADGITYLFGQAECPRCTRVFTVADAYATANLTTSRPQGQ